MSKAEKYEALIDELLPEALTLLWDGASCKGAMSGPRESCTSADLELRRAYHLLHTFLKRAAKVAKADPTDYERQGA